MTKPHQTYLDILRIPPEQLTSSADLRCILTGTLKTLLQQTNHTLITPPKPTLDPETFLNSLKTHPNIYQACMSRQFAADLPPDIEQTSLKDEPKDWFIKTADFGDDCDRVLQHRNGNKYSQLLEDLAHYHQILQQDCDRIIVLRPSNYGSYNIQLTAAMQCLGYTKEQFQFIVVQPLKLYAFHKPTQQVHPIPDIAPQELLKAVSMDALRWYSLRVPLTGVAPINISTAGRPTHNESLERVKEAHAHCYSLLHEARRQGTIQLDTQSNWQIALAPTPLSECVWDSPDAATLANLLHATPKILQQSAAEVAPHLICHHLEAISETCCRWLDALTLTPQTCALILAIKQTIFDLLENILGVKALESA